MALFVPSIRIGWIRIGWIEIRQSRGGPREPRRIAVWSSTPPSAIHWTKVH